MVQFNLKFKGFQRMNNRIRALGSIVNNKLFPKITLETAKAGERGIENYLLKRHQWRGERLKRLVFVKRETKNRAMIHITEEAAAFQKPGIRPHWARVHNKNHPLKQWIESKGLPHKYRILIPSPSSEMARGVRLENIAIKAMQAEFPEIGRRTWKQEIETRF